MIKSLIRILQTSVLLGLIALTAANCTTQDSVVLSYPETLGGRFVILPTVLAKWDVFPCAFDSFYVIDRDTINTPAMHQCVGDFPTWSPDGTEIAFVTSGTIFHKVIVLNMHSYETREYEITRENVAGRTRYGEPVSRLAGCKFSWLSWTDDGKVVLKCLMRFVSQPDDGNYTPVVSNSYRFFVWHPETQQTQEIVMPADVDGYGYPAILGSDNDALIVNIQRKKDLELGTTLKTQTWSIDIATGEHEILMDCESLVGDRYCLAVPSPLGHYTAIFVDKTIQIFDQQYNELVTYTFPESPIWSPAAWSPDETQLVFEQSSRDLTLLRLDTHEMRVLQEGGTHRSFLQQKQYITFANPQWLDDEHVAVVRISTHTIPGNLEAFRETAWLQVIRVEDNQIWTLFEQQCDRGCNLEFDWTPHTK